MNILLKSMLMLGLGFMLASCIVVYPTAKTPSVEGLVLDAYSKQPVAGASVMVTTLDGEKTATCLTNANGRFLIPAIRQWQMYVFVGGDCLYTALISVQHPKYIPSETNASSCNRPDRALFQTIRLNKIR